MTPTSNRSFVIATIGSALIIAAATIIAAVLKPEWWKSSEATASQASESEPQVSDQDYNGMFSPFHPYPQGLPDIKIGTSLLEIKIKYQGSTSGTAWSMNLEKGPFNWLHVQFDDQHNPTVRYIAYRFPNEDAAKKVRKQAVHIFPPQTRKEKMLGEVVYWDDVGGVAVYIDNHWYRLTKK